MANEEHLKLIKEGRDVWNRWRNRNPLIKPELTAADLRWASLSKADLSSKGRDVVD